MKQNTVGTHCH